VKILLIPGTTLIAKEMRNSLIGMKDIEVYGAGFDLSHPDCKEYEEYFFIREGFSSENWSLIENAVIDYEIDLIFPAHDQYLYDMRDLSEIAGARIVINNKFAIETISHKSKTYDFFKEYLPTPEIIENIDEIDPEVMIFIKPDRGQGGCGAQRINKEGLDDFLHNSPVELRTLVISEYIPGLEYTVDCFSNTDSDVMYCSPRLRVKVENGVAVETRISELEIAEKFATTISSKLKIIGPWFFQLKAASNGEFKLLEVGLRIAGASGINRLRGINLMQLQIFQELGFDVSVPTVINYPEVGSDNIDLDFEFEEVFLDFDDTMTSNRNATSTLMDFISECEKHNKPVSIVSRHSGDLLAEVNRRFPAIKFKHIEHITDGGEKFSKMPKNISILFLDDSYSERRRATSESEGKILALDPSVLNLLVRSF
jgi:hypothetical protein